MAPPSSVTVQLMLYGPLPPAGMFHVVILSDVAEKVPPEAVQLYKVIDPSLSEAFAARFTYSVGAPAYTVDGAPVISEHTGGLLTTVTTLLHIPVAEPLSVTVRLIFWGPIVAGAVQIVVGPDVTDRDPADLDQRYETTVPSVSTPLPVNATFPLT